MGDDGFWELRMVFRGAGELFGVAEVFWAGDDGFLRGGGGGFLYDYSGFRPVRERNCSPGVLTCADPEAGGSVLSSLRLRRPSGYGFRRCRGGDTCGRGRDAGGG